MRCMQVSAYVRMCVRAYVQLCIARVRVRLLCACVCVFAAGAGAAGLSRAEPHRQTALFFHRLCDV